MTIRKLSSLRRAYIFLFCIAIPVAGFPQVTKPTSSDGRAAALQRSLDKAVDSTMERFAAQNLKPDQIAVSVVDLSTSQEPVRANYRGNVQIYPASVVKLFYLAAIHEWLERGKLQDTDELRRALRDMIVDSSNDATHYIVDILTETTSGPELVAAELQNWYDKRNAVNRYFARLGYTNINVNRKPWAEGPYGRELQSIKLHQPNHRNWLTTDATARLMTEIVTGRAVSRRRSEEMMTLLKRDPFAAKEANFQARAFTGKALSPGDKLWSKAGWTSEVRHDAAYVETTTGLKMVLVIFTTGHATQSEILPTLAKALIAAEQNH